MRYSFNLLRSHFSLWNLALPVALSLAMVSVAAAQESPSRNFTVKPLALPGANGFVTLDYFAYDHANQRL